MASLLGWLCSLLAAFLSNVPLSWLFPLHFQFSLTDSCTALLGTAQIPSLSFEIWVEASITPRTLAFCMPIKSAPCDNGKVCYQLEQ